MRLGVVMLIVAMVVEDWPGLFLWSTVAVIASIVEGRV
jgi:hypothetical protein